MQVRVERTTILGGQLILPTGAVGGTGGVHTLTVVESLPSPPALLAVSVTVYVPSWLKRGRYVVLELLLGEPPLALHEYVSMLPPLSLVNRHLTLSLALGEDGVQPMVNTGRGVVRSTVTVVSSLSLSAEELLTVSQTVLVPDEPKLVL